MAKKVRMDNSLLKNIQIQSLMNTPEAAKLEFLDKQMASILNDRKLKSDEKIAKFEESLARFKNIQNKIMKQGGVNLVNNPHQEFIDALKIALEEVMVRPAAVAPQNAIVQNPVAAQNQFSRQYQGYTPSRFVQGWPGRSLSRFGFDGDTSDEGSFHTTASDRVEADIDDDNYDNDAHNTAIHDEKDFTMIGTKGRKRQLDISSVPSPIVGSPTPFRQPKFVATPQQQKEQQQNHSDISGEIEIAANPNTPTPQKKPKSPTQDSAAKRAQANTAKLNLEKFLNAQGISRTPDGKRVDFESLEVENVANTKFVVGNYHKVMNYITSPTVQAKKPPKTKNLITIIYNTLKKRDPNEFKKMLKYMPNLKNLDAEYNPKTSVTNWETMERKKRN